MNNDELLALILKEKKASAEQVPEGWRTVQQWAAKWSVKRRTALEYLRFGIEKGLVEMQTFRVDTGYKVYKTPHYRQKTG